MGNEEDTTESPMDTPGGDIDSASGSDESDDNRECPASMRPSSSTDHDSLFSDYHGEDTGASENDVYDDRFAFDMGNGPSIDDEDDFEGGPVELEQGYGQELVGRAPAKRVGGFEYDDDDNTISVVVKKPQLVS